MNYEQSRAALVAACEKHLSNFHKVDVRNDVWQCNAPIQMHELEAIMREAELEFQPGFGEELDEDGCWYVWPIQYLVSPGDNRWGMAIGVDGSIYMNLF